MKIIEQFLMGKRKDPELCEDGIFVSDDFIAVIDGVTSKGKQKWCGKYSSGGHGKNTVLKALEHMPADIDVGGFFEAVDNALYQAYKRDVEFDDNVEYLRVCMVVYSRHHSAIWSLGDCQCMINGEHFETSNAIDGLMSDLRAFVIESARLDGLKEESLYADDIGRAAILPFIKKQFAFENIENSAFGYGVLNGHGVKTSFVISYPVNKGDTVILASDGYPKLFDTLEKSEAELARLLKEDPLCCKENRGTKGLSPELWSFDDRTYIKFEV